MRLGKKKQKQMSQGPGSAGPETAGRTTVAVAGTLESSPAAGDQRTGEPENRISTQATGTPVTPNTRGARIDGFIGGKYRSVRFNRSLSNAFL